MRIAAAIFLALVIAPSISAQKKLSLPKFRDYRVSTVYGGLVAAPNFGPIDENSYGDLRCFGEDPSYYTSMHVNFAGHYVVSACSCGSGCHYLFLWDAKNGKVYRAPFPHAINVGPDNVVGRPDLVLYDGERYQLDSSLLILDGRFEDTCDTAKRYFVWTGDHFRLLRRIERPLPRDCRH